VVSDNTVEATQETGHVAAMHEILHIALADYVPFIILICCGSFFLDAQGEFLYSPLP
jgi:hypothetical protein